MTKPSRMFLYGSMSFFITVSCIIVTILLNIVVTIMGERYTIRLDLTGNQLFQLSDGSIRLLERLDKDVKLYILAPESFFSGGNSLYFKQAQDVMQQYAKRSSHITLEYIDLTRSPGFERRFPQFDLYSNLVILESADRTSSISLTDLFDIEFDQYENTEYITSSKAEQALSSAIMHLTSENQVIVTFLEGFDEKSSEGLKAALQANNFKVIQQNILTEDIDRMAWVAVICAPNRDYPEEALRKLDLFLNNRDTYGKSLLYFPSVNQPPTPKINAFLANWGITVDDGIIFQTNNARVLSMNSFWSAADYAETKFSSTAISRRLLTVVPEARPISTWPEANKNVQISTPLIFTDTAVVAPLEYEEDWDPSTTERYGPIPAFAISSGTPYSQKDGVHSNVLVFGSNLFVDQSILASRSVGNLEYILNVFGILTETDDLIYIAPKTINHEELPIAMDKVSVLGITFIVALPLSTLLLGGIVNLKRRRQGSKIATFQQAGRD